MKVLLENLLRHEDGRSVTKEDIQAVAQWLKTKTSDREIAFRPARVLMQDFTGVPAVVDLAAMRDAMKAARRRSEEDQSAGAGRSRHRSFGDRQFLRQQWRLQEERRRGIQAEPGALQVPEMGAGRRSTISASCRPAPASAIRSISNISSQTVWTGKEQGQARRQGRERRDRLSRHAGRHQFAHHHGQRPFRARLGRRRHRGGSRDARPAATRCCCRK